MARTRSYITALSNLLASCPQPIYALDARGRIVYCNPACTAWLGVDAGQLLGQMCQYRQPPEGLASGSADFPFALCPPPQALRGSPVSTELVRRRAEGDLEVRSLHCAPLGLQADSCVGTLVCVGEPVAAERSPRPAPPTASELHAELRKLLGDFPSRAPLNQVIGCSPPMARVRQQVQLARQSAAAALIAGPPGSGREYVARAIHYGRDLSAASPLAPLACILLDAELLETTITAFVSSTAELEFDGPIALLLLEVDQLAADAQAALMGVLGIAEFQLRTICTARQPLTSLAAEGRFRKDLAFALSTMTIEIPPLHERPDDVPLLAQWFLERANAVGGRGLAGFSEDALERLVAHPWPGNGDELADVVAQTCARAVGPWVQAADLPEVLRFSEHAESHPLPDESPIRLDQFLAEIERELLRRALQRAKGNRAKAARLLGVSRARLLRRMEQLSLD